MIDMGADKSDMKGLLLDSCAIVRPQVVEYPAN